MDKIALLNSVYEEAFNEEIEKISASLSMSGIKDAILSGARSQKKSFKSLYEGFEEYLKAKKNSLGSSIDVKRAVRPYLKESKNKILNEGRGALYTIGGTSILGGGAIGAKHMFGGKDK